jgi:transposase-like protein
MGITAKHYNDETAAREHLEAILWPDGPICPRQGCGIINEATKLEPHAEGKRNGKIVQFKTHARTGTYKCRACEQQFSVTVGTIFEDSKIPLHKWLLAIHLMCSSKKGISAHQLMRNLEIGSYRTAWFMAHRIRWALGQEPIKSKLAGIVEIDETWIGGKQRPPSKPAERGKERRRNPRENKAPVVAILERGGNVRSSSVDRVTSENIRPIVDEAVDKGAIIMTDSATPLKFLGKEGHTHHVVDHHAKEYVRHEDGLTITTNTIESYFAIIKRGNYGIYHHWDRKYMDQYLREFDFRYNVRKLDDTERFGVAVGKTSGKRLMLKEPRTS